jgi:Tfp pilus assembly protein PilF
MDAVSDLADPGIRPNHLVAFAAHMRAGATRAALIAASEACHDAPHLPQAHYAYGEAWLALGEPARAEQAFAAALRIAPAWAEAWVNYGLCRYRLGAIEDAKTAMRAALSHEPTHPVAAANLGAFMRITGDAAAAEALLIGSIAKAPDNLAARLNLAVDMLNEERAAEALALLEAAPCRPSDPRTLRHWYLQTSIALLQLGRPAEARAELAALAAIGPLPPDIAPLWHWRHRPRPAPNWPRSRRSGRFRPTSRRCGTGATCCWPWPTAMPPRRGGAPKPRGWRLSGWGRTRCRSTA